LVIHMRIRLGRREDNGKEKARDGGYAQVREGQMMVYGKSRLVPNA
jgi:hypothetical protein